MINWLLEDSDIAWNKDNAWAAGEGIILCWRQYHCSESCQFIMVMPSL